jgi:site-specific DNA-methyltransferase (cytosine-N4-specific)
MSEACEIIVGDCRKVIAKLPEQIFQCAITSPPYWGLRDYGIEGQIGAEMEMEDYISDLVAVFREVRRVLRDDGSLWLNIWRFVHQRESWLATSGQQESGKGYELPSTESKRVERQGIDWDSVAIGNGTPS